MGGGLNGRPLAAFGRQVPPKLADDLRALGYVLAELLFSSLAELPPGVRDPGALPTSDRATLARVWERACERDVTRLRALCGVEPAWRRVIELLDGEGGAGWALLGALLGARDADATTARDLLESPFFTVVPQRRKWRHTS